MRIPNLTATVFAIGFTATSLVAISTTASASCSSNYCRSTAHTVVTPSHSSTTSSYGNSYMGTLNSYRSTTGSASMRRTHYGASTANCPAGTRPSSDGTCLVTGNGSTYSGSTRSVSSRHSNARTYSSRNTYTRSAPLSSYTRHTRPTSHRAIASVSNVRMSSGEASHRYGSGSISRSYTDGTNTIVPFSTTTTNISRHRLTGMGSNEFLTPTTCPVSVYNPNGGKVLGCYSVSKPAPVRRHVQVYTPRVHTVRVVRPVIYVRYPVPVPVPFPVYQQAPVYNNYVGGCSGFATRYGANWPGRPCG